MWQEKGRQAVRDAGIIPVLIELLPSHDGRVAVRAAGALHNLSGDQASVRAIRKGDGLQPLVDLLRSCNITRCLHPHLEHLPSALQPVFSCACMQVMQAEHSSWLGGRGAAEPVQGARQPPGHHADGRR